MPLTYEVHSGHFKDCIGTWIKHYERGPQAFVSPIPKQYEDIRRWGTGYTSDYISQTCLRLNFKLYILAQKEPGKTENKIRKQI